MKISSLHCSLFSVYIPPHREVYPHAFGTCLQILCHCAMLTVGVPETDHGGLARICR